MSITISLRLPEEPFISFEGKAGIFRRRVADVGSGEAVRTWATFLRTGSTVSRGDAGGIFDGIRPLPGFTLRTGC